MDNLETQGNQGPPMGGPPKNYLVESILVTVLCCLPLGVVGIINASKVESAYNAGDIEGANKAAADAKKWTMWGVYAGIAYVVGIIIFALVTGGLAFMNS